MSLLTITLKNNLQLDDVPPGLMSILTEKLTFFNPRWLENDRLGRWNRGTPKMLRYYDKVGKSGLWIPRGYMRQLILLCRRHGIKYRIDDQRRLLPPADFVFKGHLKPFQQVAEMNRRSEGQPMIQ